MIKLLASSALPVSTAPHLSHALADPARRRCTSASRVLTCDSSSNCIVAQAWRDATYSSCRAANRSGVTTVSGDAEKGDDAPPQNAGVIGVVVRDVEVHADASSKRTEGALGETLDLNEAAWGEASGSE